MNIYVFAHTCHSALIEVKGNLWDYFPYMDSRVEPTKLGSLATETSHWPPICDFQAIFWACRTANYLHRHVPLFSVHRP